MTISTREFATFCGPEALGAVAGITPIAAAHVLRTIQIALGQPATGPHTDATALVAAIHALGFKTKAWLTEETDAPLAVRTLARVPGIWVMTVVSDGRGHVLVSRDGAIVAGDPHARFSNHRIRCAWDVTPVEANRRRLKLKLDWRTCPTCGKDFVIAADAPSWMCPGCLFAA